ncbi:MAG: 30S ribosomal protein S9 [Parcubacteria group bacterium]
MPLKTKKSTKLRARKRSVVAKSVPPRRIKPQNVQAYYAAVGRRKSAVARVRVSRGKGAVTINGKTLEQYFPDALWQASVSAPLVLVGVRKSVDVSVLTNGGGVVGQAEAARHGIARALERMDAAYRPTLKKAGFLRRDPREKERKKYGLKRARRAPQFSKR